MHRKLFIFLFFVACSTTSVSAPNPAEPLPAGATDAKEEAAKAETLPEDTIESLGKDIDSLERALLGYLPPYSPKQEKEIAQIKAQMDAKETKRSSMELQKMLGELKDEGE